HGDVLMWLMKTLLTSWCINQRGAGQEMAEYTNVNNGTSQQELALYKAIIKIKDKTFSYNGKTLTLSNGLKAQAVVFLEERPLYMWMFTPFYKMTQSVSGPIDE
ncbi:hypothetical protein ABN218_20090, partial [Klebsiella michiganensis]